MTVMHTAFGALLNGSFDMTVILDIASTSDVLDQNKIILTHRTIGVISQIDKICLGCKHSIG